MKLRYRAALLAAAVFAVLSSACKINGSSLLTEGDLPVNLPPKPYNEFIETDGLMLELRGDYSLVELGVREKDLTEHGVLNICSIPDAAPGLYFIPLDKNCDSEMKLRLNVNFKSVYGVDRSLRLSTKDGVLIKEYTARHIRDSASWGGIYDISDSIALPPESTFSDSAVSSVINNAYSIKNDSTLFLTYMNKPVRIETFWKGRKTFSLNPVADNGRYPSLSLPSAGSLAVPVTGGNSGGEVEVHLRFSKLPELDSVFMLYNTSGEVLLRESPTLLNFDQQNMTLKMKLNLGRDELNSSVETSPSRSQLVFSGSMIVNVLDGNGGEIYVPAFNRGSGERMWCGFPETSANEDIVKELEGSGLRPKLVMDWAQRSSHSKNQKMVLKSAAPFSYDYDNASNNTHRVKLMAIDEAGYTAVSTLTINVLPFPDKDKPTVYFTTPDYSISESDQGLRTFTVAIDPPLSHPQDVKIRIGGRGTNASASDYTISGLPGSGSLRIVTIPHTGSKSFSFTLKAEPDNLYPYYSVEHTNIHRISNEKVVFSVELVEGTTACRLPIMSETEEYDAVDRSFIIQDDGDKLALKIVKDAGGAGGFENFYIEGGADTSGWHTYQADRELFWAYPRWRVEADKSLSENGSNTVIPGHCENNYADEVNPVIQVTGTAAGGSAVNPHQLFSIASNRNHVEYNFEGPKGWGGYYYSSGGTEMWALTVGADNRFTAVPADRYMTVLKGTPVLNSINSDTTLTFELIATEEYRVVSGSSVSFEFKNR